MWPARAKQLRVTAAKPRDQRLAVIGQTDGSRIERRTPPRCRKARNFAASSFSRTLPGTWSIMIAIEDNASHEVDAADARLVRHGPAQSRNCARASQIGLGTPRDNARVGRTHARCERGARTSSRRNASISLTGNPQVWPRQTIAAGVVGGAGRPPGAPFGHRARSRRSTQIAGSGAASAARASACASGSSSGPSTTTAAAALQHIGRREQQRASAPALRARRRRRG